MTNKEQFLAKLKEMLANRKPNPELVVKHREMLQQVIIKLKECKNHNVKNYLKLQEQAIEEDTNQ